MTTEPSGEDRISRIAREVAAEAEAAESDFDDGAPVASEPVNRPDGERPTVEAVSAERGAAARQQVHEVADVDLDDTAVHLDGQRFTEADARAVPDELRGQRVE